MTPLFKIWSNEHRAWWKDERRGYALMIEDAGNYNLEEACEICLSAGFDDEGFPNETIFPA